VAELIDAVIRQLMTLRRGLNHIEVVTHAAG
jgi:hypothetical protein